MMLKYKCLVLDHDDTVVQSMKTLSYPFWCLELEQFRPGVTMSLEDYILECHRVGFAEMCRERFHFTEEELKTEHKQWMEYILQNIPDPYPGIDRIIRRQKEEGGLICVVSHSHADNILRDYRTHFAAEPDAIYGWELEPHQRKPNPWPLEDIMKRFHLTAEEILVVDDMKLACQMAAPLGVRVAYAGWSGMGVESLSAEMEKICDYSFGTTQEFEDFLFV
ncbi:MAG: HAD family hydrolase [Ruminococcaceae bacterium]|nr:HAD family hydrolase [Oscillospiraceae bacterium]